MKKYIFQRVIQAIICVIGVSIIAFSLTRISGDPVLLMVPPEATEQDIIDTRQRLGLDRPYPVQYFVFITGAVRGDFGMSLRNNMPAWDLFKARFPNTVLLAVASMALSVIIGIPLGVISAARKESWFDRFGKVFAVLGQSLPVFWLAIMLMLFFAVKLRILPTSGIGSFKHLVMPAVTLGWFFTASLLRMSRSSMLDVLDEEYIKMARTVGISQRTVIWKQALKNAFIPILTLGTMNFVILLNGTVITETVFNWPGIGRLVVDAVYERDFPVVQMCVMIGSVLVIFGNLFVDIVYAYIDPRIHYD